MSEPEKAVDWREEVEADLERFRFLPRAPGRSFLGVDGRLDMDELDDYYEGQQAPERLRAKPSWERKVKT